MTILEARLVTEKRLGQAGIQAKAEVDQILEYITGLDQMDLLLFKGSLSAMQEATLDSVLKRRERREPLQHILGYSYFYGLKLKAAASALIPRPETESLVELAIKQLSSLQEPFVLDMATGSGAVALAIKHSRADAKVWASDISKRALELAKENAERLGLDISFFCSDLFEHSRLKQAINDLDLLVANLPYLPLSDKSKLSAELAYDPAVALYAGEDGLDLYKRLEAAAFRHLKKGAICVLELDPRNVQQAFEQAAAWAYKTVSKDLNHRERFLLLVR